MYTDKEVKEILDRVYSEAYDAGIDDTLEYFEENYEFDSDDSFDLMDEYDNYSEATAFLEEKISEKDKRKILRMGRFARKLGGDAQEKEAYEIAKARFNNTPDKKSGKAAAKAKIKELNSRLSPEEKINRREHLNDVVNKNGGYANFEKRSKGFLKGKKSGRKMQF